MCCDFVASVAFVLWVIDCFSVGQLHSLYFVHELPHCIITLTGSFILLIQYLYY